MAQDAHEGVQARLNRIAQRDSFQSIFKELCNEFMVPELQADESQKMIYSWFCKYAHKGVFETLKVDTNSVDNPPSIAIPFLAYLREYGIPHLYVVRGRALPWPLS